MAKPISFRDAALTRKPRRLGPGRHQRFNFFRRFMAPTMARRAASSYHISRGTDYYYPKLMAGLREVDYYIREVMSRYRVDRDRAIRQVWETIAEQYRKRGYVMDTWRDVYTKWLDEKLS